MLIGGGLQDEVRIIYGELKRPAVFKRSRGVREGQVGKQWECEQIIG